MLRVLIGLTLLIGLFSCEIKTVDKSVVFKTPFEVSNGNQTPTYARVVDFYIQLAKAFSEINVQTIGETDSGYPLHLVTYNPDANFNFTKIAEKKTILLINNGIHPGESDGIDATMVLFRDLAEGRLPAPKNTVLATIPVYNVGGALNRNSATRANQNGPEVHGFRGNTQNYDLNRDFIKADTQNARTFAEIFHIINPDVFIDNHVSNGADYQYTLTHLFTQHDKLGGKLGEYLHTKMMPNLESELAKDDWNITPYVNVFNRPPETGFSQFMDHPRYSTGYTTLWNTLGMMVETHMLKPYEQRVEGTYGLMVKMLEIIERDGKKIKELRKNAGTRHKNWTYYPIKWKIDTTRTTKLNFKGFQADTIISQVTGMPRLKYDRNKPFEKEVAYQNYFIPSDSIKVPSAYIIKKGWRKVIELLVTNKIQYEILEKDSTIQVESYKIDSYKTRPNAYEGHYPHYDTSVVSKMQDVNFSKNDIIIPTDQPGIRYILETLEPEAIDSFFNWNFFDTILQQKEGFSPYVFEDYALEMIENDAKLKIAFEAKKATEENFAQNWYAQLDWLFKRSKYYEPSHMQYPVYRILKER